MLTHPRSQVSGPFARPLQYPHLSAHHTSACAFHTSTTDSRCVAIGKGWKALSWRRGSFEQCPFRAKELCRVDPVFHSGAQGTIMGKKWCSKQMCKKRCNRGGLFPSWSEVRPGQDGRLFGLENKRHISFCVFRIVICCLPSLPVIGQSQHLLGELIKRCKT